MANKAESLKHVIIRLEPDDHARFKSLVAAHGTSFQAVLSKYILENYFKNNA